jgi:protein-tyrosine phosphatase
MKILMVCLGNICRSPLAQGIMEQKIHENGLSWTVDSCGTGGWHSGELPDPRSTAEARKHGIDLNTQRARQFRSIDIDEFDLIFAMDRHNKRDIQAYCNTAEEHAKVKLIMDELNKGEGVDVPDPYYGGPEGFQQVYNMLDEACEAIVKRYNQQ